MKSATLVILIVFLGGSLVGCGHRQRTSSVVDRHQIVQTLQVDEKEFVEVARENFVLPNVAKEMVQSKVTEIVCNFAFDGSELTETDEKVLDETFAKVEPGTLRRVEIEGHCCNIGEDKWNDGLSQQRAEAVAEYLERMHDVPRDKMITLAYGEARPKHPNDTPAGRAANRRCEVVIVQSGKEGLAD